MCYMYTLEERYGRDPTIVRRASEDTFNGPLRWVHSRHGTAPRLVFTCSLSDFFHETADKWRPEAWEIIRKTPTMTYQILTKRPERIADHLPADWGEGWPNVWLGVSGETYVHAIERGAILSEVPAKLRFLSAEPWLERVITDPLAYAFLLGKFGWAILGGESGKNCRPFNLDTAKAFRDGALAAGVPFFLKQLGGHPDKRSHANAVLDDVTWTQMPGDL